MSTANTIELIVELDASPEEVFRAISDPQELTKWFPDAAVLEPKVGGKFMLSFYKDSPNGRMKKSDRDFINKGRVLEIVPNRKLVHTWQWTEFGGFPETVVKWELVEIGNNKTRLTLTHSGFTGREEGPASMQDHNKGWSFFLGELASYCKK